ncbi:hypothetical protein JR316_0001978 [Psilocybe cubensis]|uniref:Uncharacterized protein n=2 Tax=Psilocybe cubensis TaxID=181762 RepID=A0ACB8HBK8_PSICU|nr:hypothetical protein JR316_0001978 [Psilocybe cubensis]KAH9485072.1 hypothetical protein JR316_0001978 [Psilocybe cubensis]
MALPEMDKQLRILVESAIEEAQFDHAIAIFDTCRSPHHRPSPILLLHTLYISLHHNARPSRIDDPTQPVHDPAELLRQSPRKMMRHHKSDIVLHPSAVRAAHRLLRAFVRTNPAAAFAPALPFYPESKVPQLASFEYIDSPIHPQAIALKNARSVWDVLRSDWIVKTYRASLAAEQKAMAKQRRSSTIARESSFAGSFTDWTVEDDSLVVGDNAWHTLEWFVDLFEADAEQSPEREYRHSSLLLRQLPPPTIGSHKRWDASEPLKIIFFAFKQSDLRRQRTGLRLFNLLLELTQSGHLDLIPFASTVLSQISLAASASPSHTHRSILTDLLTRLSSTSPAAISFKLVLCKKILALLEPEPEYDTRMLPIDAPPPMSGGSATTTSADVTATPGRGSVNSMTFPPGSPVATRPRIRPRPKPAARIAAAAVAAAENGLTTPEKKKENDKVVPNGTGAMGPPPVVAPQTPKRAAPPAPATPVLAPTPAPASAPAAPTPAPPLPQMRIQLPPLMEIAHLIQLNPPAPKPAAAVPSTPRRTTENPVDRQTRRTSGRLAAGPTTPTRGSRANGRTTTPTSKTTARVNVKAKTMAKGKARAKAQVKAKGKGKAKATHEEEEEDTEREDEDSVPRGSAEPHVAAHTPWTTPRALLLRIRFELVRAWIGARAVRECDVRALAGAGGMGADVNGNGEDGVGKREEKEREDADVKRIIDEVFGPPKVSVKQGEAMDVEDGTSNSKVNLDPDPDAELDEQDRRDKTFYWEVLGMLLRAAAGSGR